jgi:ATP-dependent exoDNAse (exonuclease V) alpha subunit
MNRINTISEKTVREEISSQYCDYSGIYNLNTENNLNIEKKNEQSTIPRKRLSKFDKILEIITNTDSNALILAKAGTGKSTLIREFKENSDKNILLLAPTGVAAQNINGKTIHSKFELPLTFLKPIDASLLYFLWDIDSVVIDEISMVRADLLDAIDWTLRISRENYFNAFGGVQIILVGDPYQLAPVVGKYQESFKETEYTTEYFFSAKAFFDHTFSYDLDYFELVNVYRQKDDAFIKFLDKIRDGSISNYELAEFNRKCTKNIEIEKLQKDYTILATTRKTVSVYNKIFLERLPGNIREYRAEISGIFDSIDYPTEEYLQLKENAKIIMIKNDIDGRWVNGTSGIIIELFEDTVKVEIDGIQRIIEKETWYNFEYTWEKGKREEIILGSFTQFPFILGWALTIHRSQGKTLNKIYLNREFGMFCAGQLYTALSRCKDFESITLKKPLRRKDIISSDAVKVVLELLEKYGEKNKYL